MHPETGAPRSGCPAALPCLVVRRAQVRGISWTSPLRRLQFFLLPISASSSVPNTSALRDPRCVLRTASPAAASPRLASLRHTVRVTLGYARPTDLPTRSSFQLATFRDSALTCKLR